MHPYSKPHLSYAGQVERLSARGLDCGDRATAERALEHHGYYRLGAYLYPFRRLLLDHEPRETAHQYRGDDFVAGATLSAALELARFDAKLRSVVLEGLGTFETVLRARVAYVLGQRDVFGHANAGALGPRAADRPPQPYQSEYATQHEMVLGAIEKQLTKAASEDFIQHFRAKYAKPEPIWLVLETVDFGTLVRLYRLLHRDDQNAVARTFGITDGTRLVGAFQGFNVIRNQCAHHTRLWNRRIPQTLATLAPGVLANGADSLDQRGDRDRLYGYMALLAYMLRATAPDIQWPASLKTQLLKITRIPGVGLGDMGCPPDFADFPIWRVGNQSV